MRTKPSQSKSKSTGKQLLSPLVAILSAAMEDAGVKLDIPRPTTRLGFAKWYLEVIKGLERAVANQSGQQAILSRDVQMLCRCALSASTLREAIDITIEYSEMLSPRNDRQSIHCEGDLTRFSFYSLRRVQSPLSHLLDVVGLFAFYQLFQWLIGVQLKLEQVAIGPAQRDDVLPFLRLFNAPVLTADDAYTLEFTTDYLSLPVVRAKSELAAFISTFPCDVFDNNENELLRQVEVLMMAALQQAVPVPTVQELAKTLDLSESTFRRRLSRHGCSYRELRERCLLVMAKRYLQRREMPIAQIARQLNFSDDTAFRRAFKGWCRVSPSRWRASQEAYVDNS